MEILSLGQVFHCICFSRHRLCDQRGSRAQALLKLASPGVPDIYQGNEM
jgi:maltooligosyltrehalose synthase